MIHVEKLLCLKVKGDWVVQDEQICSDKLKNLALYASFYNELSTVNYTFKQCLLEKEELKSSIDKVKKVEEKLINLLPMEFKSIYSIFIAKKRTFKHFLLLPYQQAKNNELERSAKTKTLFKDLNS